MVVDGIFSNDILFTINVINKYNIKILFNIYNGQ